jgi:hypothetical protein
MSKVLGSSTANNKETIKNSGKSSGVLESAYTDSLPSSMFGEITLVG